MNFEAAIRENNSGTGGASQIRALAPYSSSSAVTSLVPYIATTAVSEPTTSLSERTITMLSVQEEIVPQAECVQYLAQSALGLPRELLQLIGGYIDDHTDYYGYVLSLSSLNKLSGAETELISIADCAKYNDPYRTAIVRDFLAAPVGQRSKKDMDALIQARECSFAIEIPNYPFTAEVLRDRFEILINLCPKIQSITFSFQNADEETAHLHEVIAMFAKVVHLRKLHISRISQEAPTQAVLDAMVQCEALTSLDLSTFHIDAIGLHFLLSQLSKIEELNLSGYAGEVSVLNDVRTCTALERLNLSHTNICVLRLPQSLRSIDLSYCMHLSESNNNLEAYPQLTSINLSNTRCSTVMLDRLLDTLPNLVSLNVEGCSLLSEQMVRRVHTYLEQQFLAPSETTKELDLSNAHISEARLIEIFSSVPNLETVHLSGIKHCTNDVLEVIGEKCQKLRTIHFGTFELEKAHYRYLFSMIDTLEECTSKTYSFADMTACYKKLRAMEYKRATTIDFSGAFAFAKEELEYILYTTSQLHTLILHEGWKKDAHINTVCACTELAFLRAPDLSDEELIEICTKLPNLSALDLSDCKTLSGKALLSLAAMKSLTRLDLSGTKLTDKELPAIVKALPHLEVLSLANCFFLSSSVLTTLQQCTELRDLNLEGLQITDQVLHALVTRCTKLECLNVSNCRQLSDFTILKSLPKLRALYAAETKISDAHLKILAPILKQLTHIGFAKCAHIGKEGFMVLNEMCALLVQLDLSKTEISDLSVLSKILPNLFVLQLNGCVDIAEKGFFNLQKCTSLVMVDVSNTNLTCEVLDALVLKLPKLQTVVYREVIVPRVWAEAMYKKYEGIEFKFPEEMIVEESSSNELSL